MDFLSCGKCYNLIKILSNPRTIEMENNTSLIYINPEIKYDEKFNCPFLNINSERKNNIKLLHNFISDFLIKDVSSIITTYISG